MMKKKWAGSGLLGMVLVIATGGMLGTVSVPRFIDIAGDTRMAATESLAALLNSASIMNFAKEQAEAMSGSEVASCDDVSRLLEDPSLLAGYQIGGATLAGAEGATVNCSLRGPGDTTAQFRAIKVDPSS